MSVWGKQLRIVATAAAMVIVLTAAGLPMSVRAAAPTQQPPSVHLAPLGTLGAMTVPLRISWPAATPNGSPINHYELQMNRDGGSWTNVPLPKPLVRSATEQVAAWAVLEFRVRAVDQTSAASYWAESAPSWLETAQETDPALTLSAGWQIVTNSRAFGGARAVTTQSGQWATFTFTGREVGWVSRFGPDEGSVRVAPDGKDPAQINLNRSRTTNKRIVFIAQYPSAGAHSLTITTQTAGARVDVDAFVVLADPINATLVGAGDIASCSSSADSATAAVVESVSGIVFTAGDNVYPDGAPQNYTNCYDPTWGAFKSRTRPIPGNHDYENTPGATGYFGYFGAAAGDPAKGWYKYDASTWRIYALNSECTSTTCPQQLDWLKANLAAEPHLCTLAMWHRPRWSTGPHGNSTRMDAAWKVLAANGADVVVNGHDHMYERYAPLDANGAGDPNGIREFVVGTGGASLYGFQTGSPLVDVRDDTSHGVLRLDLTPGAYSWQFLPSGSDTFTDSGTGTCH